MKTSIFSFASIRNTLFLSLLLLNVLPNSQAQNNDGLSIQKAALALMKKKASDQQFDAKIQSTAKIINVKPKALKVALNDLIGFQGLNPSSREMYIKYVSAPSIKARYMTKKERNLIITLNRQATKGQLGKFHQELTNYLKSRSNSPYGQGVTDFLNNIAHSEGYNNMLDYLGQVNFYDPIDINDYMPDFGNLEESALDKAINDALDMTAGFGETGKYQNLGVLSATGEGGSDELTKSIFKTVGMIVGAFVGGAAAFELAGGPALVAAAPTGGGSLVALAGVTVAGAGLGATIGEQVGDTVGTGVAEITGDFMPPCTPNNIEDCVPGMGF